MSNNNENKVIRHTDEIKSLQLEKEALHAKIDMIDSVINTLNATEKQIIQLRYFNKLKLESIAVTVNKDFRTIQYTIDKCLKKMDRVLKNCL